MKIKQQGFTLIELVVVIVILGILAVVAAPRFIGFGGDARVAALDGLKGSIQSANSLVHSRALLNPANATTVATDGGNVTLVNGYIAATVADLNNAVEGGFGAGTNGTLTTAGTGDWVVEEVATATPGTARIWQVGSPAGCSILYTAAAANGAPTLSATPANTACQ